MRIRQRRSIKDFSARAQALSYKAAGLSSYIVPEILAMDESVLNGLIRTEKELPVCPDI